MAEHPPVYLALGSNLGDRAANLHAALRALSAYAQVEVTSFLYETPPAYVLNQPPFLNACCRLATTLSPHELLAALQTTEQSLGRRKARRYGPRSIDLDILFYGDLQLADEVLAIPHPRLAERDFVLEPLCDLDPGLRHPTADLTMQSLWERLGTAPLPRVMPVGSRLWAWGRKTYVMGIVNVTPASFSGDDLGLQSEMAPENALEQALAQAEQMVAAGADCLDIGGQSSHPGHELAPVEEEIAQIEPVVRTLAGHVNVPISVGTFRPPVARAALAAGAHMLNDFGDLHLEPELGRLAAQAFVPLVVVHNRSQPAPPANQAHLSQPPRGVETIDVIREIQVELLESLDTAQSAGLPRWLLVADPGYGFGKTPAQHLALTRRLDELVRGWKYPLLVGPSREGFAGNDLGGLAPEQGDEGTLALCVLAIDRGVDLLRVHDVQTIGRAARMADAVVRGETQTNSEASRE